MAEGAAEALFGRIVSFLRSTAFLGKNWDNYAIDTVINGKELGLDILAHLDVVSRRRRMDKDNTV